MNDRHWLVLDVGNTHTVAGLFPAKAESTLPVKLKGRARFRTDHHSTGDEYRAHLGMFLSPFLNSSGLEQGISRVIVSSVVPSVETTIRAAFGNTSCLFIHHETPRKFELDLPIPEQLGADRLANVAGALRTYSPPLLIVDAGTATTFCLIDQRPSYIGGTIVPGLDISWKALQARAAMLHSVKLKRPDSPIGRTTDTQLQSGVLLGYEALIEGMTDRLLNAAGAPFTKQVTCIATGGCVSLLKLSDRFQLVPDLTLMGLYQYGILTNDKN